MIPYLLCSSFGAGAFLRLGVGDKGAVIGPGLSLRPQHFFLEMPPWETGIWNGMECR